MQELLFDDSDWCQHVVLLHAGTSRIHLKPLVCGSLHSIMAMKIDMFITNIPQQSTFVYGEPSLVRPCLESIENQGIVDLDEGRVKLREDRVLRLRTKREKPYSMESYVLLSFRRQTDLR